MILFGKLATTTPLCNISILYNRNKNKEQLRKGERATCKCSKSRMRLASHSLSTADIDPPCNSSVKTNLGTAQNVIVEQDHGLANFQQVQYFKLIAKINETLVVLLQHILRNLQLPGRCKESGLFAWFSRHVIKQRNAHKLQLTKSKYCDQEIISVVMTQSSADIQSYFCGQRQSRGSSCVYNLITIWAEAF